MIDSHCHLNREPLLSNLSQVLIRAKDAGVKKLLTICTTTSEYSNILDIISKDQMIYGTFGIHPHETKNYFIKKDEIIKKVKISKKIIGVGETGLDFYYNNSDKDTQLKSFQNHIEAAISLNIPLIIHSRNAENETYDILKKNYQKNLKILMHCFTGSTDLALNLIPLNAYFSASISLLLKTQHYYRKHSRKFLKINSLLKLIVLFYLQNQIEEKNEPSYIKFTAQKLANLRNIELEKLITITTKNFNTLFFNTQ